MLVELPLQLAEVSIPDAIEALAEEAARRSRRIRCFGYVASSHPMVYRALHGLPRGRWCEWGSGMGINTGIAALLGFPATGIELEAELAAASRELLAEFGLSAEIITGDFFQTTVAADYYYVYCWPGQMNAVEEHFLAHAPPAARLLICHGAEDVRLKAREV